MKFLRFRLSQGTSQGIRHHIGRESLRPPMSNIRSCTPDEQPAILAIVNAAAERYRGAIPADCWHEPYMSAEQLARDIGAAVNFYGCEDDDGQLAGVMGIQHVKDVTLVRHAYVRPDCQGHGVGGRLLEHLEELTDRAILIGTWAAAGWAIGFYQRHGYTLVSAEETVGLLEKYWDITPRQAEASVVLAKGL
jgi:GNAT superfamily N-acetyltransferase